MKKVFLPLGAVLFCALLVTGVFFLSTSPVRGTVTQVWDSGIVIRQEDGRGALFLSTGRAGDFQVGDQAAARVGGALFEVSPCYYEHTYFVRPAG